MITLQRFVIALLLACMPIGAARAQVSISYDPTTLNPGVPTVVTMTLIEDFGDDFVLDAVKMVFEAPAGLDVSSFEWLPDEFNDITLWFVGTALPSPEAAAFASSFTVAGNEMFELAEFVVTADAQSAGSSLTLDVFVDSAAVIRDLGLVDPIAITSGRSVTFDVTGSGGGDTGGDDGDTDPDDDTDMPGDDPDDGMGDDPDDMDGDDPDSGDDQPDDDDGDAPDDDAGDDGDDGSGDMPDDGDDVIGDDGDSGDDGNAGDGNGDADDGDSGMTPDMMPFCGPGMILPSLFALASLSVMKVHRRRKW